jgi:hypothetical protein
MLHLKKNLRGQLRRSDEAAMAPIGTAAAQQQSILTGRKIQITFSSLRLCSV